MAEIDPRDPQPDRRRGATLVETLVMAALAVVAVSAGTPLLARIPSSAARTISLKNLVLLGEAHACYAADWEDRQFSMAPKLAGTVNGNCTTYLNTVSCPNQALLGWGASPPGSVWGYYLSGGACTGFAGGCSNWPVYLPFSFTGSQAGFGCFRLPSLRGFQEYVAGRYFAETWFSTLDGLAWEAAKPLLGVQVQFAGDNSNFAFPSYVNSPAALFHPGVLRRPSDGGFQHPNAGFADAYDAPASTQCLHPELKSRMIEHSWLVDPPADANPAWSEAEPYYFNQGIASKPGTLFFDGSVDEMTMVQAVADDAEAITASGGVDGLWSRDTPLGSDGYFGAQAFDDTRNSFHILTTDGILGRDFLRRVPQGQFHAPRDRRRGGVR